MGQKWPVAREYIFSLSFCPAGDIPFWKPFWKLGLEKNRELNFGF
jgi:hypothetical protein